MQREFDGIPGTRITIRKGLFLLVIDGIVVLKFKKFNHRMMSSNIPTFQSSLYLDQELPGMPPNGLLHVGYLIDKLNSNLDGIYITCRSGNMNVWTWPISVSKEMIDDAVEFKQQREPRRPRPIGEGKKKNSGETM